MYCLWGWCSNYMRSGGFFRKIFSTHCSCPTWTARCPGYAPALKSPKPRLFFSDGMVVALPPDFSVCCGDFGGTVVALSLDFSVCAVTSSATGFFFFLKRTNKLRVEGALIITGSSYSLVIYRSFNGLTISPSRSGLKNNLSVY